MKERLIEYCNSVYWDYYKLATYLAQNVNDEDLRELRGFNIKEKAYNFIHENKPQLSKELKDELNKMMIEKFKVK